MAGEAGNGNGRRGGLWQNWLLGLVALIVAAGFYRQSDRLDAIATDLSRAQARIDGLSIAATDAAAALARIDREQAGRGSRIAALEEMMRELRGMRK